MKRKIVAVSGFFDPLHAGHVSYIMEASQFGDVIVILNSDEAARKKKGYVFMPWDQRASVVGAIRGVVDVVHADDADGTVCATLGRICPDYFAKGGDRHIENTPEVKLCEELGISLLFNIGGEKTTSSSDIVRNHEERLKRLAREWD